MRVALTGLALAASQPAAAEIDPFVDAARHVPGLALDMRYAGSDNFVGRPIAGYEASRCLLTPQAARARRWPTSPPGRATRPTHA